MEKLTVVSIIQAMLAPGLMISACGLLILGMNNKYSLIVNRIRLLMNEKRNISEDDETHLHRKECIDLQIVKLNERMKLVRNSVVLYSSAVGLFIISSLFIGLKFVSDALIFKNLILGFFLLGVLVVLTGVFYATVEAVKGYKIVQIEIKN